jgi:amino acid transporter
MLWLWILCGLAALFALFCLLRLGVLIAAEGGVVSAWVTLGPLRLQVAPSKKKPPKKSAAAEKKPEKKKKHITARELVEKLEKLEKPTREELRLGWQEFWPPLCRALARTRRGIRVDPMQLFVTLAGESDPAGAAERCGWGNMAVWTVMPALEQLLTIPHPGIHVGVDFDRGKSEIFCHVGITLRIGTLLAVGWGAALPALKFYLRYRKQHRKPNGKPEQQKPPASPAA